MHAACSHALVARVNDDSNTFGPQNFVDGVSNLGCHFLLNLKTLGKRVDNPSQFADAYYSFIRQVTNMSAADDWHHVVLAMGLETDPAQNDQFVIAICFFKGT